MFPILLPSRACGRRGRAVPCAAVLIALTLIAARAPRAQAQGQPLVFSAMGDVPYSSSEAPTLQRQIRDHNRFSAAEFMVHIGDIKSGTSSCSESVYRNVAGWLRPLAVPTYILPGDNETTDCSSPSQAWTYWTRYFTDFEAGYCGAPVTAHQSVRRENLAFITKGVLCVGIDMPSPPASINQTVWNAMLLQDADWVTQQFADHRSEVRAAVVFSQDGPGDSKQNVFFTRFRAAAAAFGKPVLLLHGDDHSWKNDHPFAEANIERICLNNGGDEDPVQVTVTMDPQDPFVPLRNPWSGTPAVFDAPPCVSAGADLAVTLPAAAALRGRASDDGDPAPPGSLSLLWSVTSGAGSVAFANPGAAETNATFGAPGSYVLRLTASDGHSSPWDEVAVTVTGTGPPVPAIPAVSIADARIVEGNAGTTDAVFTVTLTNGGAAAVALSWATSPGTASANQDYTTVSGSLSLSGAAPTQTVRVPVAGDVDVELDETFFVDLTLTSAGTLTRSRGVGTIANDDQPAGPGGTTGIANFAPLHDTKVNASSASSSYGNATTLRVKTDSDTYDSYLKFAVSGLAGVVQSAVVQLYCTDTSDHAGFIYTVADAYRGTATPWIETGLKYNNAPVIGGSPLNTARAAAAKTWVEFDVTAAVTGNGTYSFGIHSPSGDSVYYSSKEGSRPPVLRIVTVPQTAAAKRAGSGDAPGGGVAAASGLPLRFEFGAVFPNPTRGAVAMAYALPRSGPVTLAVFDVRGRAVHRADLGVQRAGVQRAVWDGNDSAGRHVGSGVYYVLLRAGGETRQQRVTVLR